MDRRWLPLVAFLAVVALLTAVSYLSSHRTEVTTTSPKAMERGDHMEDLIGYERGAWL